MGVGGSQLVDPETRAADPRVCPFLRSTGLDGTVAAPSPDPSADHRCHAADRPESITESYQGATCLVAAHVECPRYLLGLDVPVAVDAAGPAAPDTRTADATAATLVEAAQDPSRRTLTPAVVAATGLLVLSAAVSFAFVAARGGLSLPTPGPSGIAVASPSLAPSGSSEATPTPVASSIPTPVPSATPDPTPVPTPSPTRTPRPTDPPSPTPFPTDGIWRYFEPCPAGQDCVIYVVRTGNTLYSISRSFDVPLSVILEMNPGITDPAVVVVGDEIRLPTPD